MNTLIHLWIEPLVKSHERNAEKIYVNLIIDGDFSELETHDLENIIEGEHMAEIMDLADIDSNWNYSVVFAQLTDKKTGIKFGDSPEQKKEKAAVKKINKEIAKIVTNKMPLELKKENVEIHDGGKINISLPALRINDTIDFGKLWQTIEKDFIGKINKGDTITLTDDEGNNIFEMIGGDFLNIGLADLSIYDPKKLGKNPSMLDKIEALKGGVFLRDDGSLDIGDSERTFYLKIHTNNLLKASLKLKKSLMELTSQKLLNNRR